MRKSILIPATAAAVVGLAAPAMAAGPPYTVTVGSYTAGSFGATVTSTTTPSFTVIGNGDPFTVSCAGTGPSGVGLTSTGTVVAGRRLDTIATFTNTSWQNCTGGGGPMKVTQTRSWSVRGTGTNATAAATDVIAGVADTFEARVEYASSPSVCTFTISGAPRLSIEEQAIPQLVRVQDFTTSPANVRVISTNGCAGRVPLGASVQIQARLNLNVAAGRINLS